jgi:MbtH protein
MDGSDFSEDKRLDDFTVDGDLFQVLVNAELQYSLWPAARSAPDGWTPIGCVGSKADCLAYVDAHWVDLRPKSLRQMMAKAAQVSAQPLRAHGREPDSNIDS